jgi:hypothetical protein
MAIVTDERLKDWTTRTCITGCGWGCRELAEACLEFLGEPTDYWICGCEAPGQSPSLSRSGSVGPWPWTNHCSNCGRSWKDGPDPTQEQIDAYEAERKKADEYWKKNPIIAYQTPGFAMLDNRRVLSVEFDAELVEDVCTWGSGIIPLLIDVGRKPFKRADDDWVWQANFIDDSAYHYYLPFIVYNLIKGWYEEDKILRYKHYKSEEEALAAVAEYEKYTKPNADGSYTIPMVGKIP